MSRIRFRGSVACATLSARRALPGGGSSIVPRVYTAGTTPPAAGIDTMPGCARVDRGRRPACSSVATRSSTRTSSPSSIGARRPRRRYAIAPTAQAREVLDDLRRARLAAVAVVVNTHGHYDHVLRQPRLPPGAASGATSAARRCSGDGRGSATWRRRRSRRLAADLAEVELDPPDRRSPTRATSTSARARRASPFSAAGTPTTTSCSRWTTPTSCAPATCSRTARSPTSATATRSTGPRPRGRSSRCWASRRRRSRVTARRGARGSSPSRRPTRSAVAALGRRVHAGDLTIVEAVAAAPWPPADSPGAARAGDRPAAGRAGLTVGHAAPRPRTGAGDPVDHRRPMAIRAAALSAASTMTATPSTA